MHDIGCACYRLEWGSMRGQHAWAFRVLRGAGVRGLDFSSSCCWRTTENNTGKNGVAQIDPEGLKFEVHNSRKLHVAMGSIRRIQEVGYPGSTVQNQKKKIRFAHSRSSVQHQGKSKPDRTEHLSLGLVQVPHPKAVSNYPPSQGPIHSHT